MGSLGGGPIRRYAREPRANLLEPS